MIFFLQCIINYYKINYYDTFFSQVPEIPPPPLKPKKNQLIHLRVTPCLKSNLVMNLSSMQLKLNQERQEAELQRWTIAHNRRVEKYACLSSPCTVQRAHSAVTQLNIIFGDSSLFQCKYETLRRWTIYYLNDYLNDYIVVLGFLPLLHFLLFLGGLLLFLLLLLVCLLLFL